MSGQACFAFPLQGLGNAGRMMRVARDARRIAVIALLAMCASACTSLSRAQAGPEPSEIEALLVEAMAPQALQARELRVSPDVPAGVVTALVRLHPRVLMAEDDEVAGLPAHRMQVRRMQASGEDARLSATRGLVQAAHVRHHGSCGETYTVHFRRVDGVWRPQPGSVFMC